MSRTHHRYHLAEPAENRPDISRVLVNGVNYDMP